MQKTFFPSILLVASLVVLSPTLTLGHEGHHAECTDTAINALKADIQAMGEGEAKTTASKGNGDGATVDGQE